MMHTFASDCIQSVYNSGSMPFFFIVRAWTLVSPYLCLHHIHMNYPSTIAVTATTITLFMVQLFFLHSLFFWGKGVEIFFFSFFIFFHFSFCCCGLRKIKFFGLLAVFYFFICLMLVSLLPCTFGNTCFWSEMLPFAFLSLLLLLCFFMGLVTGMDGMNRMGQGGARRPTQRLKGHDDICHIITPGQITNRWNSIDNCAIGFFFFFLWENRNSHGWVCPSCLSLDSSSVLAPPK